MLRRSMGPVQSGDPVQIGPYLVLKRLGAGSMGQVYLGRSPASRLVAVKTIRSELAEDPSFRERFAREAAAARRVSGAFTAAVVDADPEARIPWLATSYVPAPSLATLVDSCGPLPVPAVRWLAAGCAEALESIHRAGLVHRDLKPANLLIAADGPKIIDFGLVRAEGSPYFTLAGNVTGTPAFMAPEQATGSHEVGPSADVYSLGATLLFAATGHPPYPAATGAEAIELMATGVPDLTRLPEGLRDVVESCLARDPADRPSPEALVAYHARFLYDCDPDQVLPPEALRLIEDYRLAESRDIDTSVRVPRPRTASQSSDRVDRAEAVDSKADSPAAASARPGSNGRDRIEAVSHRRRYRSVWFTPSLGLAAVAVCAAGVGVGWIVVHGHGGSPPTAAGQNGPALPNGGPPGGPPAPAVAAELRLTVNQSFGDSHTVFVLHGTGWPPGASITVSVIGGLTSPDQPVVDDAGTFSYAVNQNHEFTNGDLQPGTYRIQAATGATAEQVTITVAPARTGDAP